MSTEITVTELSSDDWNRLRDLRLAALADSPAILAGKLDEEQNFTEEQWRETFKKLSYVVATIDGKDVAMINIENLVGDFGATCGWVVSGLIPSIVDLALLERSLITWIQLLVSVDGWFKDWE